MIACSQEIEKTPVPNESYTITAAEAPGTNVITKYEWSETEKNLVPVYYSVDLKQKEYGHPEKEGAEIKEIKVKVPSGEGGTAFEYAIKYYIDDDRLSERKTSFTENENIDKDFIANHYSAASDSINNDIGGGAIFNEIKIGDITGDFVANYVTSSGRYPSAHGGAIYNNGTIEDIDGNFIGNSAFSYGGAIYNGGTIGDITGDFIGNYIYFTPTLLYDSDVIGGAIYNGGTIGDITGNFIGNYSFSNGGSNSSGGAIYNSGTIGDITGDFIGNYASSTESYSEGGAINNRGTIGDITGDFIGNYASSTESYSVGGAINNSGTIGEIKNSSFIGNSAGEAGGAIFSVTSLNIIADNGKSIFSGNKTISNGKEEQNAIAVYGFYVTDAGILDPSMSGKSGFVNVSAESQEDMFVDKNPVNITLKAENNGTIFFDDTIKGGGFDALSRVEDRLVFIETPETAFDLKLTGDNTGKIILNNDVINANIKLDTTNVYLGRDDIFNKSQSITLESGNMSMINNSAGVMHLPSVNLTGSTNLSVDADLANKNMDRIAADKYNVAAGASLNVNNIHLISDAKDNSTTILFADRAYSNNVAYTGESQIAYSPIYKYDVSYNINEEDGLGYFTFSRGGASSDSYDNFNPSVLPTAVSTQAGAFTTQMQTFNYAFQHSDNFMILPSMERLAIKNQNRYALSPTGDATDVGTFSPLFTPKHMHNGFWVKPYASFENIPLKNGPKVSNINYGTLIGYDSEMKSIKRGFDRVLTGYIGYNGASQRYSGIDTYQNGGVLGGTITLYKGNFFNATTLSAGASSGSSSTMYGNENYTMLLGGIGNKTGYNFEFKEGKYILQPSVLLSYTFVNTFDYNNAQGVRINSDPLHAIQLAPGVKIIMNTESGWQPYVGVNMVWNILDKQKVMANDVRLPEMSIKPYVEYGIGLQKCMKEDSMTAYGQAMIHNGGRNGISLSVGLRWKVGKK